MAQQFGAAAIFVDGQGAVALEAVSCETVRSLVEVPARLSAAPYALV